MARLNKINANIANLKGETRKKMNLKIKSMDEEIKNLKIILSLSPLILTRLASVSAFEYAIGSLTKLAKRPR